MIRRLTGLAVASLVAAGGIRAQTLRGTLRQSDRTTPASGARVWLVNGRGAFVDTTRSNENGRFEVQAPGPGEYHLVIRRLGFIPEHTEKFSLRSDEARDEEVVLLSTQVLPTIDIAVSRDTRRWFGIDVRSLGSQFVRPEKLDLLRPFALDLIDLVRHANILGVQIRDLGGGEACVEVRVQRGCADIFLDGMMLGQTLPSLGSNEIESLVVLKPLDGVLVSGRGAVMVFTGR